MINNEIIEKMRKSPITGRPYSFSMETLLLIKDSVIVLIDNYRYELSRPAETHGDDIFISIKDLEKIFAPDMKVEASGEDLAITFLGMKTVLPSDEMIPVRRVMSGIFGMTFDARDDIFALSYLPEYSISPDMIKYKQMCLGGKTIGDFRMAYWNSEVNRINTYRFYIPSSYNPAVPSRLAVCLHGAGGNSDSPFDTSENMLSYYAEKFNYLLLAPNSYVMSSNYGGGIPPLGMFRYDPEKKVSVDPGYYSETVMGENKTAENMVFEVFEKFFSSFNVDPDHVYIMGNSMGAIGTFHLVSEKPEMFRAAAPAGALPMLEYLPYEKFKEVPMMVISGTEDTGCVHYMRPSCDFLSKKGMNIKLVFVGGGNHKFAWTYEIEEIFRFFEQNV